MHRSIAIAIAVTTAAFAGNAFADDITMDTTPFTSTKTRTEVLGELKKPGPNYWSSQYNMFQNKSARSSQDVMNEYVSSRREVSALNGEDSGSAYLNHIGYKGSPTTTMGGAPAR
jgi:hypothetical protein